MANEFIRAAGVLESGRVRLWQILLEEGQSSGTALEWKSSESLMELQDVVKSTKVL